MEGTQCAKKSLRSIGSSAFADDDGSRWVGAPAGNRNRLCRLRGGCIATMLQGRMVSSRYSAKLTNGRRFRCASRKTGAVARSAVQFWTFTMSNSKKVARCRPRARNSRRAHARVVSVFDPRAAANADTRSRVISGMWLSVSLRAHRVPPAWWRRVVARRRLVRLSRSLSGRFNQCREARVERAGGAPRARSLGRPRVRGAERDAI